LRAGSSPAAVAETAGAGAADPNRPLIGSAAPRSKMRRAQLLALVLEHTGHDLSSLKTSSQKLLERLPANIRDELLASHEPLSEAPKRERSERAEHSLQLLAERCYDDALPELLAIQHAGFEMEPCVDCRKRANRTVLRMKKKKNVTKHCRVTLSHTALGSGEFVASKEVRPILKAHFSKLRPNAQCKFGPAFIRNFKDVVRERGGQFKVTYGRAKYWFAG
jgi:hypothetical protein